MDPQTYPDLYGYQDPQHVEHLQADADTRRKSLRVTLETTENDFSHLPDILEVTTDEEETHARLLRDTIDLELGRSFGQGDFGGGYLPKIVRVDPPLCPECGGRGINPYCSYCDGAGVIYS